MRRIFGNIALWFAVLTLVAALAPDGFAAGKPQVYTGEVSDAVCGAKHDMSGSAAECTRTCVSQGSKYALVVGEKVYVLDTNDKTALDKLDELAGQQARVTGSADGDTISVTSVASAGK
jgi:hypothetical protein